MENTAVGIGQTCTPITDKVGRITDKEHRPNPERSWMAATRLVLIPGVSGNTSAGINGVKKSVEQAVGSDILFSGN